jgi:hypothetical protein
VRTPCLPRNDDPKTLAARSSSVTDELPGHPTPVQLHQTAEIIVLVTPMPEADRQWQVRHQGAWEAVEEAMRYT